MSDAQDDNIWAKDGGIYFGFGCKSLQGPDSNEELRHPLRYVGDAHVLSLGPTGSGKTTRVLFPSAVELNGWSQVYIDPKGKLAAATIGHRKKHSRVICLNPFDELGLGSDGFNPVAALDPKSPTFPDDAMGLAVAIVRVEGVEPHWSASAQDLVCALIMYARLVFENPSLAHVRSLLGLSSAEFQKLVVAREFEYDEIKVPGIVYAAILHDCPELEVKAKRFVDVGPDNKELMGVFSTALTQTRWLDSRPIKSDLSKAVIDFSVMKHEPTTVYLILPANRLGTHSSWLRLMITSILQSLMEDSYRGEIPVLVAMDEFAQMGFLEVVEQNLALIREYGIKLFIVVQDLSQLKAIYRDRWESFVSNAGVVQSFAPQDVFTSEYLSKLTGTTTVTPLSGGAGHDAKLNMSQMGRPLFLPHEIRSMAEGVSLIFSNKLSGTALSFMPRPDKIAHLKAMFLDFFGNMKRPKNGG